MHTRLRRAQQEDSATRRKKGYKPKDAMRVSKESEEDEKGKHMEHLNHILKHSGEHGATEFAEEMIKHKMSKQVMDHGLETVVSDLTRSMLKRLR